MTRRPCSPAANKYAELIAVGNLSMARQGKDNTSAFGGLPSVQVGLSAAEANRQVRGPGWRVVRVGLPMQYQGVVGTESTVCWRTAIKDGDDGW